MEEHYLDTVGVGGSIPPVPTNPVATSRLRRMKQDKAIRPRDKGDVPDDPLSRMRHSASHVMADAVRRLRPNAKVAIGPSIDNGFYLRLRHRAVRARGRRAHRGGDAEDHRREPAVRAPRGLARRGARALSSRAARSTRSRSSSRSRRARRSRTSSTATSSTCAAARTSSARATSRRSRCCRSRAPTGAATSATPSSSASTARRSRRRRSWTSTSPGSRRPSAATTGRSGKQLDLYSFDDLVGPGLRALAPEGRLRPLSDRGHHPRARTSAAATSSSTRRTSRASSCSRPRATSSTTRTTCSAAWSSTASATSSSR